MPRSTRTRRRCVVTFFDSIWNLALAAVTNERVSCSELAVKRSSSARMPVTAHHEPGEVPLAWQGGRELGAEPDNCVSSRTSAWPESLGTPASVGQRAWCPARDPLTATGSLGGPSPRRSEVGYSAPGLVPGQEHAVGKRPGLHQVQVHPVVQGR